MSLHVSNLRKFKGTKVKVVPFPTLQLAGDASYTIASNQTWVEPGALALSATGADISNLVTATPVTSNFGNQTITYSVTDPQTNLTTTAQRQVFRAFYIYDFGIYGMGWLVAKRLGYEPYSDPQQIPIANTMSQFLYDETTDQRISNTVFHAHATPSSRLVTTGPIILVSWNPVVTRTFGELESDSRMRVKPSQINWGNNMILHWENSGNTLAGDDFCHIGHNQIACNHWTFASNSYKNYMYAAFDGDGWGMTKLTTSTTVFGPHQAWFWLTNPSSPLPV